LAKKTNQGAADVAVTDQRKFQKPIVS
jgi:hypothetical protein